MSGSPRRRCARCKEDISGQFRVTVPDAGELDQLRTRGGVYRRGLYTAGNRDVFQDPQLAHKYAKHLDKKVQVDSSVPQEPKIVPDPESATDTQY